MGGRLNKSVGDVAAKMLSRVAIVAAEFAALVAIGKRLGPDDYALWSQTILTATLLVPLASSALDRAIVRFLPFEEENATLYVYRALVGLTLISGIALGAMIFFGRFLAAEIVYGNSSLSSLPIYVAGLLIGRSFFIVGASYFQAFSRIRTHAAIEALWASGRVAILVALPLVLRWGLNRTLMAVVCWEIVLSWGIVIYAGAALHKQGPTNRTSLSQYYRFSLPLIPAALTYWVITYADRLFLVHYRSLTEVGQYAAAYRLATALSLFYTAFSFALPPVIFRLWERGRKKEVSRTMVVFTHGYLLLAIPACVGISHLSTIAFRLFASGAFTVSKTLVFVLTTALLCLGLNAVWTKVIFLKRRTKTILGIHAGIAVLNCLLNLLLIPRMGIHGAALSTLFSYAALALLIWRSSRGILPRMAQASFVLRVLLAAGLTYCALFWWHPAGMLDAVLWGFSYMSGYGFLLWVLLGFPTPGQISSILLRGGDVLDASQ